MQGEIFFGIISHVVDSQNFYAVTLEELKSLNEATESLEIDKLESIFWIPTFGEKFLVNFEDDGEIFRAQRTLDGRKDMMSFYLLDTGEVFQSPIKEMLNKTMFLMPEFLKKIQPIAFRCVWNAQGDDNLQDALYGKFTFEVLEVNDELVRVNMWKFEEERIDLALSRIEEEEEVSDDSMDSEQLREILDNEEPVIFDVQVAVQGFHTRDDERRCQFYDFRTGGCWKKGRCKLHHFPDLVETFRDKKAVNFYDVSAPPQPKCNILYDIKIISFNSLNSFTCYYLDEETFYHGKSLQELRKKLNSEPHNRLEKLPAIGELVTAKIKGKFYRARILEEMDDFMTFPVYLVDEGTYNERVLCEHIYEYCAHLKDFPFFAIEMTIADMEPLEKNSRATTEAQNWILATQQNAGPMQALIV